MNSRIDSPDTGADIELRAILSRETASCFIVNAGAGSGKTTSLVKALAYLRGAQGTQLRRLNQKVACITYTEIAAGEIHGEINLDPLFHVSTIHSFLWTIIRPFTRDIASWVGRRIEEKIVGLEEHNAKPRTQIATRAKNTEQIARLLADKSTVTEKTTFTYGVGSRYAEGILGHDDIIKMVPQLILEKPLLRYLVAQQYPFIFVDESQDTFLNVVGALKAIAADSACKLRLGFFGDPMQRIYTTGIGKILVEPGWDRVDKPENFRCPTSVLVVINNIRKGAPEPLNQTGGRRDPATGKPVEGSVNLFVLPLDGDREAHLGQVRDWLAATTKDQAWQDHQGGDGARVLVIEHRLAARRLGFETVFAAHHDKSNDSLKTGIAEGTAWPTLPFVEYLTPLAQAVFDKNNFTQIELVRANNPLAFQMDDGEQLAPRLASLSAAAQEHAKLMMPTSSATVRSVFNHATRTGLWKPNDKFGEYEAMLAGALEPVGADQREVEQDVLARFLDAPAQELVSYQSYLHDHSVYATHQGVKGAEFERVLVLLEDDAAVGHSFSYEKLLGLQELSKKDLENVSKGLETTIDRTRRLLYVVCSRAELSLAVVIFTQDPAEAADMLKTLNIFKAENIHKLEDLPLVS